MTTTHSTSQLRSSLQWIDDLTGELSTEFSNIVIVSPEEAALNQAQQSLRSAISELFPCSLCIIPAGENGKELNSLSLIWEHLESQRSNRRTLVIGLGGGTTLDVAGFAAATYFRGIAFWSVPTTLLAMVDAGIGGKPGINFMGYKNHIGSFTHPSIVWLCPDFLRTLPQTELLNGWAECLKHGLLQGPQLWQTLCSPIPPVNEETRTQFWLPWIESQAQYKLSIVSQDFRESGLREILNAGHTAAHALESYSHSIHQPISHGTAVAWGLLLETLVAHGITPEKHADVTKIDWISQLWQVVTNQYGPFPLQGNPEEILAFALADKKNKTQSTHSVTASIIQEPGRCQIQQSIPLNLLVHWLQFFMNPQE